MRFDDRLPALPFLFPSFIFSVDVVYVHTMYCYEAQLRWLYVCTYAHTHSHYGLIPWIRFDKEYQEYQAIVIVAYPMLYFSFHPSCHVTRNKLFIFKLLVSKVEITGYLFRSNPTVLSIYKVHNILQILLYLSFCNRFLIYHNKNNKILF